MSTEDEQRLQKRLALMSEAELVKHLSTFEQVRLIDATFAQELHVQITGEVDDIQAMLRTELDKRMAAKGAS